MRAFETLRQKRQDRLEAAAKKAGMGVAGYRQMRREAAGERLLRVVKALPRIVGSIKGIIR